MKKVILAAIVATLAFSGLFFSGSAKAHYGDLWFNTARNTQGNIYEKYDNVVGSRCVPSASAHFLKRDSWGNSWYDHFLCNVRTRQGTSCLTVAHITGAGRKNLVLTSYRYNGCTARDLWG